MGSNRIDLNTRLGSSILGQPDPDDAARLPLGQVHLLPNERLGVNLIFILFAFIFIFGSIFAARFNVGVLAFLTMHTSDGPSSVRIALGVDSFQHVPSLGFCNILRNNQLSKTRQFLTTQDFRLLERCLPYFAQV